MTNWLITGGCGFIGTALIRNIQEQFPQDRIRVLDNLSGGTLEDLAQACDFVELDAKGFVAEAGHQKQNQGMGHDQASPVEFLHGDIIDAATCLRAASDCEIIVHLAANTGVGPSIADPKQDMQSNVKGILNVLEAARKNEVSRFIFASSNAPIGEAEPPIHEEIAPHPLSPYGASKLAGEGYCSAYYHSFGLQTAVLRFGNVYGPGSTHKSSVVAKFIKQALQEETCQIYGDGKQTRDFIYIDDLVQAIIKAATFHRQPATDHQSQTTDHRQPTTDYWHEKPWGEIFQIATSTEHTVQEMARMLSEELAKHGLIMHLEHGEPMVGDIRRNYSDTRKAKKILNWQCRMGLREGLARTVDWFLEETRNSNISF
jgi:UDP-glucose 4-epimerase